MNCKYCQSENVIKFGTYKDEQYHYCKDCQRKFKDSDTLFHMKTPTNEITSALLTYYDGSSIEAIRRHLLQEHQHAPSTATIYEWIQKYTQYATDSIKGYRPTNIGNTWVADETVLDIDGQNVWLYDIIDEKTRMILATRLATTRTIHDAKTLMENAARFAGRTPSIVITDKNNSYVDGIEIAFGADTEHIQSKPFAIANDTQKIERFHSTLKARTKVMRGLKNFESARDFLDGWLVHYNYLRPHEALKDKTPAEVAGIAYPYRNWADIIRNHVPSKPVVIEHQPRSRVRLPVTHVGRPKKHIRTKRANVATSLGTIR
jgi:putative transposase